MRDALAAAGRPSDTSAEGVKATHPVFVGVDPFTMEADAVPTLYALGPLRGDNFARFAIHDGWGVAAAIRGGGAPVEGTKGWGRRRRSGWRDSAQPTSPCV